MVSRLRHFLDEAEHLRGRGLVEAGPFLQAQDADGLEQAQGAERVGVGGVLGGLEAHLHVRLRREVVDLVGLGLLDDADQVGGVGHVAVVHEEAHAGNVGVVVEMVDALRC